MKAIVLTYAPITEQEKKLLRETKIFKIACNDYAAELKPNVRLCADNIVKKCLKCDTCPVISMNYDLEEKRVINGSCLPRRNTTLISCIDYLYLNGYTSVLLVATNPDSATTKLNIEGLNSIKDCLNIYKYSKDGNLDVPYKNIGEFMLSDEEKLLGIEETAEKTLLKKTIFTDACRWEISTKGKDNKSIESGSIVDSILPVSEKQKLLDGIEELEYNGFVIKRITLTSPKKEVKKEIEPEEIQEEPKEVVKPKAKIVRKKK